MARVLRWQLTTIGLSRISGASLVIVSFIVVTSYLIAIGNPGLMGGDWRYFSGRGMQLWQNHYAWNDFSSFGALNVVMWQSIAQAVYPLAAYLGAPVAIADFIYVKLPLIATTLLVGIELGKLSEDKRWSWITILLYSANTYIITSAHQAHFPLVVSFNLCVIAICLIRVGTPRHFYAGIGALFLASSYDFRFLYVAAIFSIVLYFLEQIICRQVRNKFATDLLLAVIMVSLPHLSWIFLLGSSPEFASVGGVGRALFGEGFFDLLHGIALQHPFSDGYDIHWFKKSEVDPIGVIAAAAIPLAFLMKRNRGMAIFGSLLFIGGVFLVKMTSPPFGFMYELAYNYLPGFNAFREASKFLPIAIVGWIICVTVFFGSASREHHQKLLMVTFLIVLIIVSFSRLEKFMHPSKVNFFDYPIDSTDYLTPHTIPKEYADAIKYFDNLDLSSLANTRFLCIPGCSIWLDGTTVGARSVGIAEVNQVLNEKIEFPDDAGAIADKLSIAMNAFKIDYILVPLTTRQDPLSPFKWFTVDRGQVLNWLEPLIDSKRKTLTGSSDSIIFFARKSTPDIVLISNNEMVSFKGYRVNPIKYKIDIPPEDVEYSLILNTTFSGGWCLRDQSNNVFEYLIGSKCAQELGGKNLIRVPKNMNGTTVEVFYVTHYRILVASMVLFLCSAVFIYLYGARIKRRRSGPGNSDSPITGIQTVR